MTETRERDAMRMHALFVRAASVFGPLFGWIVIFVVLLRMSGILSIALTTSALVYLSGQVIVFLVTPLTARLVRHGTDRLMLYGTLAGSFAFLALALVLQQERMSPDVFAAHALAFSILLAIHRVLYKVPYRVGSARAFGDERPVSRFSTEILISVLPALAGISIFLSDGAAAVFYAACAAMLLAIPPILNLRPEYASYKWSWAETYRNLASKTWRPLALRSFAYGIESSVLHFLWPITAALILSLRFDILGAVVSLTLLFVYLLERYMRLSWRILSIETSTPVRATAVFSAWMFRLTAGGPFAIIAVDAFQRLAPGEDRLRDQLTARDGGSLIDELSALKELSEAAGKIAAITIILALLLVATPAVAICVSIVIAALAAAYRSTPAERD